MDALPFPAIVGQEDLKTALLLNAINRSIGGVLIRGERGTGKSSAVRGLERVLPRIEVVADCVFNCPPDDPNRQCTDCQERADPETESVRTPVVELPLGATEDRVIGSLDIERALNEGESALEPGLLARANRGILYIDEVNLLDDHLIDVLLDAAASGVNRVEREGVSVEHPAEFILVGTMNPDEGTLRPQFLDRFGLQVEAGTPEDPEERATIIEVAETFDRSPDRVIERYEDEERRLRERIEAARERYDEVHLDPELRETIAEICADAGISGNRGDITTARCARTIAALDGRTEVTEADVRQAIEFALPHRIPSDPFEDGVDVASLVNDRLDGPSPPDGGDPGSADRPDDPDSEPEPESGAGGSQRRSGSESRKDADSGFDEALRELRDFFLKPDDGESAADADENEDEQEASPGGDPGADGDTGHERNASSGQYLDPIGEGDGESEGEPDGFDPKTELPDIDPLDDQGTARIGSDEDEPSEIGRYVRSRQAREENPQDEVALDASLRSAARRGSTDVRRGDLRLKLRDGETPALVVFAVDSSASMRAHGHIATARDLTTSVLRDASHRRDYVAVVSFRDETADVIVPPTDDPGLAADRLDQIPTGNKTPLASGLLASLRLVERERESLPDLPAIVVVMTDGRPTAAIGDDPIEEAKLLSRRLGASDVDLAVLDLDRGTAGTDVCRDLAEEADGEYVSMFDLSAEERQRVVTRAVESLRSRI
ncbi:MAG: VWA domain-containing protein [Haloferacaceae archaeon]